MKPSSWAVIYGPGYSFSPTKINNPATLGTGTPGSNNLELAGPPAIAWSGVWLRSVHTGPAAEPQTLGAHVVLGSWNYL